VRSSIESNGECRCIFIATILCWPSRRTKRPYTKRILPEHLIPRSPLRSEKLVKLLEEEPDAGSEAACIALGCVDPRTARKHLRAIRAAASAKLPLIAELVATIPSQSESQAYPPGANLFALLSLVWKCFIARERDLSGSTAATAIESLLWIGPGFEHFAVFNRSCIPISGPPL
jgi:hypothetical protein